MSAPNLEAIKEAIVEQHMKSLPLMDVDAMRQGVLDWLDQFQCPCGEGRSWEDLISTFPPRHEDRRQMSGLKIRLTLSLRTCQRAYMISIMECLAPDSREVYILSAHTNWDKIEKRLQRALEEGYIGRFEDVLRTRHTVWAQTFRSKELDSALNACAAALLCRELVGDERASAASDDPSNNLSDNTLPGSSESPTQAQMIARRAVSPAEFPSRDEHSSS